MRVQIIGHSQVPYIEDFDNVEVLIYSRGGAKIHEFWEDEYLSSSLNNNVDLTILFIGGNDVFDIDSDRDIANAIWDLALGYSERSRAVRVCNIEPRNYRVNRVRRRRRRAQEYDDRSEHINRILKKWSERNRWFRLVNLYHVQFQDYAEDGVHFTPLQESQLIQRFTNTIYKLKDQLRL